MTLNDLIGFRESSFHKDLYKRERWITSTEATILYALLQEHKITRYVEAGTANGFSSSVALLAIKDSGASPDIHTWDIVDRPKIWQETDFPMLGTYASSGLVNTYVEPFAENVNKVRSLPFVLRRAFFIDADHKRKSVRKDWKAVKRLLTAKDLVIFHDIIAYEGIGAIISALEVDNEFIVSRIVTERGMAVVRKYE